MPTDIPILTVCFTGQLAPWEVPAFRGAVGRKVGAEGVLFHHHQGDGLRYAYPLIQYKRLHGRPTIVCLGEGVEAIHQYFRQADWSLDLGQHHLPMQVDTLEVQSYPVGFSAEPQLYRLRHWAPLNQENYRQYRGIETMSERIAFLERKLLVGNILAFAKGIGWHADQQIEVSITELQEARPIKVKKISLCNFHVDFRTNVYLPRYVGLGAKVSVGLGTLVPPSERML